MNRITYICGDVRDVMQTLEPGSVHLVITSPPFLALRSYLPADHVDKHREIGSEATPAGFLDTMLGLTADWRRLLAPWGSIAVEIGDTYSGGSAERAWADAPQDGGYHYRDRVDDGRGRAGIRNMHGKVQGGGTGWPQAKSLCGIPTLYTWSLAYGRNLLTGTDSPAGMWRVRNLLTWTRPNPPVGALGDKFRPATSFVTVACTSQKRWFDLDAVRVPYLHPNHPQLGKDATGSKADHRGNWGTFPTRTENPAGAPPLDWWDANNEDWQPLHNLPTAPYGGSHYATFPVALPQRLIEAMCPAAVCSVCGEPRRRIVHAVRNVTQPQRASQAARSSDPGFGQQGHTQYTTLGWSDCGHDNYRPGVVLDPFGGSGTTAVAAARVGRDCVLIDLDHRNIDLARRRINEQLRIVTEVVDGDTTTWTVQPPLPAQRTQIDGQRSIFDELDEVG